MHLPDLQEEAHPPHAHLHAHVRVCGSKRNAAPCDFKPTSRMRLFWMGVRRERLVISVFMARDRAGSGHLDTKPLGFYYETRALGQRQRRGGLSLSNLRHLLN